MKRLLFICCAFLLTLSASAEMRRSDVLLTDSGVIFRVNTMSVSEFNDANPDAAVETSSTEILVLTFQNQDGFNTIPVPASLTGGRNIEPSLAYDPDDDRVYLFWQRKPSPSASELMLTSFKDGVWSNETTFDNGIWRLRFNLKIGITHYMSSTDEEGNLVKKPAVIAHAVWWEQHGQHESARYAMLDLEAGNVTGLVIRDMRELSSLEILPEASELPEDFDKTSFRTPFILDVPGNDSVDILFADWYTNHYEIVNVHPVLDEKNGVLHIPTGVTTSVMDAPIVRVRDVNNGLMALSSTTVEGATDLIIYSADDASVDYVVYRHGGWSNEKQIILGEGISVSDAVEALQRNVRRR